MTVGLPTKPVGEFEWMDRELGLSFSAWLDNGVGGSYF